MGRRDDLLRSHETGAFLGTVYTCALADREDTNPLALELVALHNEGLIDVVGAFESLNNIPENGPAFFLTRRIFEKSLPDLNAPVTSVMRCVLRLFREASGDLTAGAIINSFIDFCEKAPSRLREAVTEIEANPDHFADLLPGTLIAASHIDKSFCLEQVIRLAEDKNVELRKNAIFSIGKLDWPEPDSAVAMLESSAIAEMDDKILAYIVQSAFELAQHPKVPKVRIVALVEAALLKGEESVLLIASRVFGFHSDPIPTALFDALPAHLIRIKSTNKETLDNIDCGISFQLKNGDSEKAIRFLEDLLLTHRGELTMETFNSTAREIHGNKALVNKVIT